MKTLQQMFVKSPSLDYVKILFDFIRRQSY